MIAKLEFDLTDPEQKLEHARCLKALDMACALFEIQYNLKRAIESDLEVNGLTNPYEVLDFTFSKIMDQYDAFNINVSEIID